MSHHGSIPPFDRVRVALQKWERGLARARIVQLGSGLDHVVFEVEGGLIVRTTVAQDSVGTAGLLREAKLLERLAGVVPLPIPTPRWADAETGCVAYAKLAGRPLIDSPRLEAVADDPVFAETMAGFMRRLRAVPKEDVDDVLERDDDLPSQWLASTRELFPAVVKAIPLRHVTGIERFLATPPPPPDPSEIAFAHNDLGIEHILVEHDTANVCGIIDWSDAAITDPIADLGRLYRDLGPPILDGIARQDSGWAGLPSTRERALFYARCLVLEDIAFGIDRRDRRYADKGLKALDWLFEP